jgi:uncharacterized membrane protein YdjX (TVP38/TMEM64 family)
MRHDHFDPPWASAATTATSLAAIWGAVAVSTGLIVLAIAWGTGHVGWVVLAVGLVVACAAVFVFALVQGRQAEREVTRAVQRLAKARRTSDGGAS